MIAAGCSLSKQKPYYIAFKISSKCYDEEIEVAGQAAAHAKIKPKKDMSIGVYSAS